MGESLLNVKRRVQQSSETAVSVCGSKMYKQKFLSFYLKKKRKSAKNNKFVLKNELQTIGAECKMSKK